MADSASYGLKRGPAERAHADWESLIGCGRKFGVGGLLNPVMWILLCWFLLLGHLRAVGLWEKG